LQIHEPSHEPPIGKEKKEASVTLIKSVGKGLEREGGTLITNQGMIMPTLKSDYLTCYNLK